MQIALERVCRGRPGGDSHELRKLIAESIILCAKGGKTGLGQLADAGERSLARIRGDTAGLSAGSHCDWRAPRVMGVFLESAYVVQIISDLGGARREQRP